MTFPGKQLWGGADRSWFQLRPVCARCLGPRKAPRDGCVDGFHDKFRFIGLSRYAAGAREALRDRRQHGV